MRRIARRRADLGSQFADRNEAGGQYGFETNALGEMRFGSSRWRMNANVSTRITRENALEYWAEFDEMRRSISENVHRHLLGKRLNDDSNDRSEINQMKHAKDLPRAQVELGQEQRSTSAAKAKDEPR